MVKNLGLTIKGSKLAPKKANANQRWNCFIE